MPTKQKIGIYKNGIYDIKLYKHNCHAQLQNIFFVSGFATAEKKTIKLVASLLSNTIFGIFNCCSSKQMAILESETRLEKIGMILEEIVESESLIFLT